MSIELRPHQKEAIEKLSNGKILYGGVGTGKTLTALSYYAQKHGDRNLLVITTAKKRDSGDWQDEARLIGLDPEKIIVDSWTNIKKYEDVTGYLMIADEQRVVGSGAWTKAFLKIAKQNKWILLSATPGDTWLDYIPVFVANGFYKNRTEFKREHVIYNNYSKFPKVDRYVGVNKLIRLRKQILVKMPYERHTRRHTHYVTVEHDKDLMKEATVNRWHVYENRPLRDVAELFGVMRKIVNSNDTRLRAVSELLQTHPRVIVFYNFDYELEMLRELGRELEETQPWQTPRPASTTSSGPTSTSPARATTSDALAAESPSRSNSGSDGTTSTTRNSDSGLTFQFAEWNGHKHEEIPSTDRWMYLVQYVAGAEGWNCTDTDTVVFHSLTYSYKNFHQAYGRIDRLNTPFTDLNYYVLKSDSDIDRAILNSLKHKRNFNESSMGLKV